VREVSRQEVQELLEQGVELWSKPVDEPLA
jgi:hypothetical protein